MGIGDTIRVSLTEEPENEVLFAKKLLGEIKNMSLPYFEKVFYPKDKIFHIKENDREIFSFKNFPKKDEKSLKIFQTNEVWCRNTIPIGQTQIERVEHRPNHPNKKKNQRHAQK